MHLQDHLIQIKQRKIVIRLLQNYRPVYKLNGFSKIYEGFLYNVLTNFTEKNCLLFIATYRKYYSSNHVLIDKGSLKNGKNL